MTEQTDYAGEAYAGPDVERFKQRAQGLQEVKDILDRVDIEDQDQWASAVTSEGVGVYAGYQDIPIMMGCLIATAVRLAQDIDDPMLAVAAYNVLSSEGEHVNKTMSRLADVAKEGLKKLGMEVSEDEDCND